MPELTDRNQKIYDFVLAADRSQGAFQIAAEKFNLTRARVSAIVKTLDKRAGIVHVKETGTVTMGPWKTYETQCTGFTEFCQARNWSLAHGMREAIKYFVDHITPGQIEESKEKGGNDPAVYTCTMGPWRTTPEIRKRFKEICQTQNWSYATGMREGVKYYIENNP